MFICSYKLCQVENVPPKKKTEIPKGRGGSRLWNSEGIAHSGISEGKGRLKHGSRPWLGMDIFWNCPMSVQVSLILPIK